MTTINYDQPVKDLIAALDATKHVTHKQYKKTSVTFHHNGGRLSHEGVLEVWKTRPASAHFDSDKTGAIAQYVRVLEYAWAAGDTEGNMRSIHIEMANETLGPEWRIAEPTWRSGARLAGWLFAKVIGARPTKDNVFVHHHWCATKCAGPFIDKIYDQLLAEVQAAYEHFKSTVTPRPTAPVRKSSTQIAAEVWAGKWGSGDDRARRLKGAGYDPKLIQDLVNRGVGKAAAPAQPARRSLDHVAAEVIAGNWGNGPDRVRRLSAAGYDPKAVQAEVNRRL